MHIVFFHHSSALYGASRSLLGLVQALSAQGCRCTVVVAEEGEFTTQLEAVGVAYMVFPFRWAMQYEWYSRYALKRWLQKLYYRRQAAKTKRYHLKILPELCAKVASLKPTLIHTNSSVINIGGKVAAALGIPHIWHIREFADLQYYLTPIKPRDQYFNQIYQADKIICISKAIQDAHLTTQYLYKSKIVYNGVFSEKVFLQLGALGEQKVRFADDKQYTFVIVGLIHPHKGQSEALKALARMMIKYPQARLQVIGGGDTQPLKALAQKLKIAQNVTFLGEVANVHQYLLEADACLVCARNEAFGRVTVEAMACRCPVIGFKSGGTAEIIRHEHNGLLYEKGSEQLAKAMERLVREHELCQQMIHKAWQEAFRQYTDEACLSQILTVYHELHPNKKPQP